MHPPPGGAPTGEEPYFAFLQTCRSTRKLRIEKVRSAVRGILAAGGNIFEDWPLERALRAGDGASGTRVLEPLQGDGRQTCNS